jgi:ADP-ribose pyrophosphatase YjhB (NUDIX family)
MPDKHFVTVKAAIRRGNRLLLQQENRSQGAIYDLPGGRIDIGEDLQNGLRREVREEIGVELEWISELPVKMWSVRSSKSDGIVAVLYEAKLASEEFRYNTSTTQEVEKAVYLTKEEFASTQGFIHKPYILEYFEAIEKT